MRALLIAGPTASGKSDLALRWAERNGGTIVNADALAVYRELRILTGRPTDGDLGRAPHRLFGHVAAEDGYSVGRWLVDAERALAQAWASGDVPVVVGGTGLYLKALTQGLSDIPAVSDPVRARVRAEAAGQDAATLHARLSRLDPETAARLRPTDPQRIVRALEVLAATGVPLSSFQETRSRPILPPGSYAGLAMVPDRAWLRGAIERRFDLMMERGALDEVRALRARRHDPALPVMRALGVPPLLAHLEGTLALEDAVARAKAQTRAYAKRQLTFARHQLADFASVDPRQAAARLGLGPD